MNVTVFVPAYRRPRPLVWSLASVLVQRFASLRVGRARIVVLNNDADEAPVERAVAEALAAVDRGPWEVSIVHRKPPLPPIENWYGGIREFADPADAVFLHGDDDIMLRGSAEIRARALEESGADLLLSFPAKGMRLIFDGPEATRAWIDKSGAPPVPSPTRFRVPTVEELTGYGLAFIGCHTYRPTARFWEAYDATYARMKTLPLEGTQQVAMLPYFLPIELAFRGGVAACDTPCVMRGSNTQEIVEARFAQVNWLPGVLYAASLNLLESGDLGPREPLGPLTRQMRREFVEWYLPTVSIAGTRAMLRALGRDTPWQFGRGDARGLAYSATVLAKGVLGQQNLVSRLRGWGREWRLPELTRELASTGP